MTRPGQLPTGATAFDSLVFDWIVALNERGMSARTRNDYICSIRDLRAWLVVHGTSLAPSEVSSAAIREWLTDSTIQRSGAVRRARWTAARSFWGWVHELGITAADPTAGLPAPIAQPPNPRLGDIRT